MGSTVTTGKLAAAFKAACNKIVYVLFEETYEKNCHPHTPNWSCFFIGTLEDAMARIFLHSASCEGGMLQGRNGYITPEGYIAGWMKELAAPAEMPDLAISLSISKGFYSPVPEDRIDNAKKALAEIGRQDIADALCAGNEVTLNLHADVMVLLALYGPGRISPWRIIQSYMAPTHQRRNAALGYAPAPVARFDVHHPKTMHVDSDNRLLQRPDGSWYCGGWEYSVIQRYICGLWKSELREPGSYRKRINAYREAVKTGQKIPDGVKVTVDMTLPMEDYQRKAAEHFAKNNSTTPTASGFEVEITEENLYSVTNLPSECSTWLIPKLGASQAGRMDLFEEDHLFRERPASQQDEGQHTRL